MLWTIFVVLLILWLLGFSLHVGGKSDPPASGCRAWWFWSLTYWADDAVRFEERHYES